jgi:hypothetical protein
MKNRLYVLVVLGILAAAFFSCELPTSGVTMSERVDLFMADVNAGNYSTLYTHIHPSANNTGNVAAATFWSAEGMFPPGEKYELSGRVNLVTSVSATISSESRFFPPNTIVFEMALDGDDYKITVLKIDGDTKVDSRIPLLK